MGRFLKSFAHRKEIFEVKYLTTIPHMFGIEVLATDPAAGYSEAALSMKDKIPLSGVFPGDVIQFMHSGKKEVCDENFILQNYRANFQPESKYRNGTIAARCSLSELACRRCPWREMGLETQLRFRIKLLSDYLFSVLKIQRGDILSTFTIENVDTLSVGHNTLPFHTLYFGTGQNLKHRKLGTIYQTVPHVRPKIQTIHNHCKIMDQETREVINAMDIWWSKCQNLSGWDSGKNLSQSRLLSLTVHHMKNMKELIVRIHAFGKGPSDYILCDAEKPVDYVSSAESAMADSITEKLVSIGFIGKLHLSVLIRDPTNNKVFLKTLLGMSQTWDKLRVGETDLYIPIRMRSPCITYDRHTDQQRILCRALVSSISKAPHQTIAYIDERNILDSSVASISLALCKKLPKLVHMVHPVFLSSGDFQSNIDYRSVSTSTRELNEIEDVRAKNGIPNGMLKENVDSNLPLDVAIIGYTGTLFQDAARRSPSQVVQKVLGARSIHFISSNFTESSEFRHAVDLLLQNDYKISNAQVISKCHSTEIGGVIKFERFSG